MNMMVCSKCKIRVLPKSDGTCPGCGAKIGRPDQSPLLSSKEHSQVSKTSIDVYGIPPEKSRTTSQRASQQKPTKQNTVKFNNVGDAYQEYRKTAQDISRVLTLNTLWPFGASMITLLILSNVIVDHFVPQWMENNQIKLAETIFPNPQAWLSSLDGQSIIFSETLRLQGKIDFFTSVVMALIPIIALIVTYRRTVAEATEVGKILPGFKEYFKLGYVIGSRWNYWPKDTPNGEKLEIFHKITKT